jgi:hypothetical protein
MINMFLLVVLSVLVTAKFTFVSVNETENRIRIFFSTGEKLLYFKPISYDIFHYNDSHLVLGRWNSDVTLLSGILVTKNEGDYLIPDQAKILASGLLAQGHRCCLARQETIALYRNETLVIVKGVKGEYLIFQKGKFEGNFTFPALKIIRVDSITNEVYVFTTR